MRTLYTPSLAGFLAVGSSKTLLCALAIGAGLTGIAQAAMMAFDNASDPAYATWDPGDNGGTGWGGGWTFRNQSNAIMLSTNGNRGWFIGSSLGNNSPAGVAGDSNLDGDIDSTGDKAFGVYSNSTDQVYAIRPLNGAMNVGDKISFDIDNGNIASGQVVGMRFLSNAADVNSRVTEIRFVGGDDEYTIIGTPTLDTDLPFTREGLHVEFTLTGASTYSMTVTRLQNAFTDTFTGTMSNSNAIVALAFKNQFAGAGSAANGYFNNISVTEVPEPAGAALLALAATLLRRRVVRG